MDPKSRSIFLLLTVLLLSITTTALSSSAKLQYQTLIPTSLPSQQPLHWPDSDEQLSDLEATLTDEPEVTLNLQHLDALSSGLTPEQLFKSRLQRDAKRVKSISKATKPRPRPASNSTGIGFSSSVVSGLAQGSGEYFTRIGVGSPARYLYMVLDTGSDVVWLQCAPCKKCYSQTDPIFDPRRSSSFRPIPCRSKRCSQLDSPGCDSRSNRCMYQVSYGDGSFTVGEFSTETLTFRRSPVPNVSIGCGHDNEGLFVGAAGLLGLGRGKLSFPSQTGLRFDRKFSYCLVDRSASAKPSSMVFGRTAASRNAVYTPLLTNSKLETFYYLELIGISVGGSRVPRITSSLFKFDPAGNGGVIIDSGTSVTRLTRPAYVALRDAFRIGASGLKRAGEFSLFDTCYDLSGKTEVKVPTVVLHFRGADVSLPAANYLIPVDSNGTFCFAFAGTSGGLSIVGNIQQQGFRVVFDLAENRVGFTPRGCA